MRCSVWVSRGRLGGLLATTGFCLVLLGGAREALAHSAGVASTLFGANAGGCNNCHGGGVAPDVTLTSSRSALAAGEQLTLTFTVTTPNGTPGAAGFNLRSSMQGTFALGGTGSTGTQIVIGASNWSEATHTQPKLGEPAVFTVLWTPAPATTGAVTFTAWGNAVNQDDGRLGDQAASASLPVMVTSCVPSPWYLDVDGDGYGVTALVVSACTAPPSYVARGGDCNDAVGAINPGATEACNGIDDNCNGTADEGLTTTTYYRDGDADGYGSGVAGMKMACSLAVAGAGYVVDNTDCDDARADVHPGAIEICSNLRDDNCNGTVDSDAPTASQFYRDNDGDGFGGSASGTMTACAPPPGYVANNTDCADGDATVHPGAIEVCNGKDDNCTGGIDEALGTTSCGAGACVTTVPACVSGVAQLCTPVCPDAGMSGDSGAAGAGVSVSTGGNGGGGGSGVGGGAGTGLPTGTGGAAGQAGRGGGTAGHAGNSGGQTGGPGGGQGGVPGQGGGVAQTGGRSGIAGQGAAAGQTGTGGQTDAGVIVDAAMDMPARNDAGMDSATDGAVTARDAAPAVPDAAHPATDGGGGDVSKTPGSGDGGCSCEVAHASSTGGLLLTLGLLLVVRRRRRS